MIGITFSIDLSNEPRSGRAISCGSACKRFFIICLLGAAILFGAPVVTASVMSFETVSKGLNCGYDSEAYLVIRDEGEWESVWGKAMGGISPALEPPKIDFSSEIVIAAFMGECPTGGYSIEIREIVEEQDKITVIVEKRYPRPGSSVTQALTQPYHIVKLEKTEKEVKFEAGVFRVNISVLTQGWAYPDEEVRVQVITFIDKLKPPQPGHAPPPLSPADWVFIGNAPVRLEVRDKAGKLVNVSIPQGLSTDDQGFLEATFKAPGEEGKYTMIAYAVIKGVECSDSEEFTVSSEERILPPAPSPAPGPSPSNSTLLATLSMLALLAVAAALGVLRHRG